MENKEEMYTPEEIAERYENHLSNAMSATAQSIENRLGSGGASLMGSSSFTPYTTSTHWYPPVPPAPSYEINPSPSQVDFEKLQRQVLELVEICETMMEEIKALRGQVAN